MFGYFVIFQFIVSFRLPCAHTHIVYCVHACAFNAVPTVKLIMIRGCGTFFLLAKPRAHIHTNTCTHMRMLYVVLCIQNEYKKIRFFFS